MGTILYGSEIAKDIRTSLKEQIDELREKGKRIPKLVVILVGDNPASLSYVTGKEKACREIGMSIKFCLLLTRKRMSMAFIHII